MHTVSISHTTMHTHKKLTGYCIIRYVRTYVLIIIAYLKYFIHCAFCHWLVMCFLPALSHRKRTISLCGRGLGGRGLSYSVPFSVFLLGHQLHPRLCSNLPTCLQLCLQTERALRVNTGSRATNCLSLLRE